MVTGEVEFSPDEHSADVIPNEDTEAPTNLWGDLLCPLRGPRFPFNNKAKKVFRDYFKDQLNADQVMFNSHFGGTENERFRVEANLKYQLPQIAARDAWRETLRYCADGIPVLAVILSVILYFAMPWLVANNHWWYNILATVSGLASGYVVALLADFISSLYKPRHLDSNASLLIVAALGAGIITWLYGQRPTGWVFWSTMIAGVTIYTVIVPLASIIIMSLPIALLGRAKIVLYCHAELSDSILIILNELSGDSANTALATSEAHYFARVIERHWRQLLVLDIPDPTTQQRVQAATRGIAAGMRQIGVSIAFPVKIPNSEESFESNVASIVAKQLTAFTTFRYGDLIVAPVPEVFIQSWLGKVLSGTRSVIAAIAPITLLFVLPKAFNFSINQNINGTLLTVSLGWLALYIIGWLDPRALTNVPSITNVTNLFKSS